MAKEGLEFPPSGGGASLPIRGAAPPSEIFSDKPQVELSHEEALSAAIEFHDGVRERARQALERFHLEKEHKRLLEEHRLAEERARIQRQIFEKQDEIKKALEEEARMVQASREAEAAKIAAERKRTEEAKRLRELQSRARSTPSPEKKADPKSPGKQKPDSESPGKQKPDGIQSPQAERADIEPDPPAAKHTAIKSPGAMTSVQKSPAPRVGGSAKGLKAVTPKTEQLKIEQLCTAKAPKAARTPAAEPSKPGGSGPEQSKAEEPKIVEPKAEEPKTVGPKAEEPKPVEPKAEVPKTSNPFGAAEKNGTARSDPQRPIAVQKAQGSERPDNSRPAGSAPDPRGPLAMKEAVIRVHRNLKRLRTSMSTPQSNQPNQPGMTTDLKQHMSTARRNIGKWIGQLTIYQNQNKRQLHSIVELLRQTKGGVVPSPPVDPNDFHFERREPAPGTTDEIAQLPSLFVYVLNMVSKKIVKQLAEECGANPKQAEPLGVLSAHVFARPEFQWRGKPMIDVLLAKLYVACPILLGARGDEKTTAGRAAVGWRRQGAGFAPDALHFNRMTGLGAGFAALSLRDFSRSSMTSPFPPWNYWRAFSSIVNTPPSQICSSQLVVLKSLIEDREQRFIQFYGDLAVVALRTALVDLPSRCPEQNSAVGALRVYAELLRASTGLPLR